MSTPVHETSYAEERPADLAQGLVAVPADRVLAAAAGTQAQARFGGLPADKTVKVWDLASGVFVATFTGEGGGLSALAAVDSSTIVAGDAYGWIHILRLEIGSGPQLFGSVQLTHDSLPVRTDARMRVITLSESQPAAATEWASGGPGGHRQDLGG